MIDLILHVALPVPMRPLFDYLPPDGADLGQLIPGMRVKVPFHTKQLVGILVKFDTDTTVPRSKLKAAIAILDENPIYSKDVYELCQWASNYYHTAFGEVLSAALPGKLRKGSTIPSLEEIVHKLTLKNEANTNAQPEKPILNEAQQQTVETILQSKDAFKVFLLDGVTGSGKTEIYLRVIENILAAGKQVLVLVPEINLTPQTIQRFRERFPVPMVVLHSDLTETKRSLAWLAAHFGEAKIIIGTRSAVFTSASNLGLIVVDEEHDTSFKQQDRFRYHGRDVAIKRANILDIPIILGSATPSLESALNVKRTRYDYLQLPHRAGKARLPTFHLINLRQHPPKEGLSEPLLQALEKELNENNQVMLFLNRRGYAPVLYCTQCAWMMKCPRCEIPYVFHRAPLSLQCHHCDARIKIPLICAGCGSKELKPVGLGTQRIEETLRERFPNIPIIRVDRDSTKRKGAMVAMLSEIHTEEKAILLGTQMLAKGHHFPQVTLVGIIDMDQALFSVNFRAAEQMGQLLLQVAGRAGRGEKVGRVYIQTHHPDHPLLQQLITTGYGKFAETILSDRESTRLPPYTYLAIFRAQAHQVKNAHAFLQGVKQLCNDHLAEVKLFGPVPAIMPKRKGLYHQHLLVKAEQRKSLQTFLSTIIDKIDQLAKHHATRWVIDIDPVEV